MLDYSEKIKDALTMRQVAEYYGFSVSGKTKKMLCPFHNDSNASLVVYPGDRGYYCYSCNAGGDVINFVQRLFNLDFKDACQKLDEDFHLGLGLNEQKSEEDRKQAEREYRLLMERKEARRREHERLLCQYDIAYNRFTFLDILKMRNRPTRPDKPISDEYVYACQNIDAAWQSVLDAAEQIRIFEQKENK